MGKQPFISHSVNGYSRYDVPESKAFSCTPGIAYPVRIDFINARDRVSIEQGVDVRSNPLAVPTFNPYVIRLHRFWVPLQLYHPEMRTNSSKFDMNNLSLNWIPASSSVGGSRLGTSAAFSNSLLFWLRIANRPITRPSVSNLNQVELPSDVMPQDWVNADSYLGYWDIVRNYYSFSQWSLFSFAWPASWKLRYAYDVEDSTTNAFSFSYAADAQFFTQCYGNLEFLDAFYESQFYPGSVPTSNNSYNRISLFYQLCRSDVSITGTSGSGADGDGYPVSSAVMEDSISGTYPTSQFSVTGSSTIPQTLPSYYFKYAHPMAVIPSSPDRFSRMLPPGASGGDVSLSSVQTIPQLAVASRLQEYKDLLGAGGSRFSDWLETFFASKIDHVDRPKLLFSSSQVVNSQVVLNQSGEGNFSGSQPLGAMGGSIAFNSLLGRKQSYYFKEPGYMIDIFSIRPVYYWAQIRPDYLSYKGSDYFNPVYNDIGYQMVSNNSFFTGTVPYAVAKEPCFNEFRSSYDEVLGQLSEASGPSGGLDGEVPLYSYWVQQRRQTVLFPVSTINPVHSTIFPSLFVDMSTVNSPFASNVEDNFFVNMSYSVRKKSLVNKTFATRLTNR